MTAAKQSRLPASRQALLVLGMHRAGTSALARVLALRGASLPAHVLPPNRGNVDGYWEPQGVVELNDRILDACETAWDDPFASQRLLDEGSLVATFRDEAVATLDREYGESRLVVLKDPRCTLLRGFWNEALAARGFQMLPIAIMRPCADVVASLVRRDATSVESAAWLYVAYGVETARAIAAGASSLTYEQLVGDWRGSTDRIAAEQHVAWPQAERGIERRVAEYLKPSAAAPSAPPLPQPLQDWSGRVWAWCREAAQGQPRPLAELQDVVDGLRGAAEGFAPVLRDRSRRQRLVEAERDDALRERDSALRVYQETDLRLREAQAAFSELEGRSESEKADMRLGYEQRLAQSEADKADMRRGYEAQLAELDVEKADMRLGYEQRLAQSEADKADMRRGYEAQLAELDAEKADMRRGYEAQLAKWESEQAAMRLGYEQRLADTEAEKADMRRGYEAQLAKWESEQAAMRLGYEQRLADTEAEKTDMRLGYEGRLAQSDIANAELRRDHGILSDDKDALLETYRQTDELLRQTQLDYQQRDRDYVATRAALDASFAEAGRLHRELEAIHASHSWRLTAPLRALLRRARGEVAWWPPRPRVPEAAAPVAPSLASPEGAPAMVGAEAPASVPEAAAPLARPHAQLRAYLVEEFGEAAAAETVLRIDRYRLPIVGDEVRRASTIECGEEQAVAWAREIARRAPAEVEAPDVSIIVPVYNQLPFTLACIDALLAHETRHSFEILVGDDASTDATAVALAEPIRRVRHIRHPANLGFVRNCNAAAARARGRYVLFLNNDTQVLPRWLDELIATLEANPAIGLAGSKLVYPDGRLQECGAIVWRDGSAWNFGRLGDPRRPEFSYLRDVDYVSGASIALRRDLWESLGGFDEAFVPAYAEDADLAFRVRDRGLRTVVQPLSQLLHFEGVSSGTDLGSGAKAYQVENLRKLHARWAHVLAGHRDNADSPELEKERDVAKRVLFVDHCTPTPHEDAGSLVAFEVMQAFQAHGYKVTFIPEDNFAHMGADTRDLQRLGIEAIYHPAYSRMPMFLDAREDPFDVVFLHRFGVGEAHMQALRRKFPRARILFLNADMHHLRESREAELSGDAAAVAKAAETRRRELGVIAGADATLVHSDFELALLRRELPGADVALFPLIHDPVARVAPLAGREGVCFVGGFRHPPNADGIRWFVDSAWPLVLREIPDAKLYIVGSHMPPEVQALGERPGVEATGYVADLAGFLDRRRASIAPLRYGAGAKGKVAGSLAQGLPIVCTTVAAEGMGLEAGKNVLVGDAPGDLAAHVVALLRDDARWHALSAAGLAFARDVTSRERAHARIAELLDRPGTQGTGRPLG